MGTMYDLRQALSGLGQRIFGAGVGERRERRAPELALVCLHCHRAMRLMQESEEDGGGLDPVRHLRHWQCEHCGQSTVQHVGD